MGYVELPADACPQIAFIEPVTAPSKGLGKMKYSVSSHDSQKLEVPAQ